MLKLERWARSSLFAPTITLPAPGETDQFQGEPTTVHQPPLSAKPQPLGVVRWKLSEAAVPLTGVMVGLGVIVGLGVLVGLGVFVCVGVGVGPPLESEVT